MPEEPREPEDPPDSPPGPALRPSDPPDSRVLTDGGGRSGTDDESAAGSSAGASGDVADEGSTVEPRTSITEGGLVRPMFRLAWPIVIIQLLQGSYNVVDTIYLGRLSAEAVGALSIAFPLIFLLIAIAGGFTAAGAILVAQYTGAEGTTSAGKVVGQTVTVVATLSVLIAVGGFFYTRPALELLPSAPETTTDVVPLAADYMEVIFLGIPLMTGFFVFAALMRGYGDTKTPMYLMVVSVVANTVIDPFFIFGFENNPIFAWTGTTTLEGTLLSMTGFAGWGIEGAAGASIVSRGLGAVIGLALLFGTDVGPAVAVTHLYPDREYFADIVRLGTPTMVEQSMAALAMLSTTAIVVTFSPPVVAAFGLGNRIVSLVLLPTLGLGRAVDTMVGQNLGADRQSRAATAVYLAAATAAGAMLAVAGVAALFTEPIVSVFLGDVDRAAETIARGVEYIRIRSVEFAFVGITQVMLGAFRGAGNTKTAMVISFCTLWVGRVGSVVLLVFALGLGVTGFWIGMAVGNVLGAIVGVAWFLRGTWREKYIDEEKIVAPDLDKPPTGDTSAPTGADTDGSTGTPGEELPDAGAENPSDTREN